MASRAIGRKLQQAIALHQAGDLAQAATLYQQILDADPVNAEAWHLSGLIDCSQGNADRGESCIRRAVRLDPAAIHFKANLAAVLVKKQQLTEAEDLCREVLRIDAGHTYALANLGTVLRKQQRGSEAQAVFEKAIDIQRDASALCNLATVLTDLGRHQEAYDLLIEARELDSQMPEVHKNLAIVLRELGNAEDAMSSMAVAEQLNPAPEHVHLTRANMLLDDGQPAEAIAEYQAAMEHNPESAEAIFGLGCALMQIAAWEEALEACRLATVLKPGDARFASGHLYAATLSPLLQIDEVVRRHRSWGEQIEAATAVEQLQPDLTVDRPLRVGYVSPDLRGHATMSFLYPLLQAHDRSKFQIVIYSETAREDDATESVRQLGDEWCCTRGLSDEQLTRQIRSDRIDILIDVAGHTAENRLPVFARKPAPVQVSFLGYPTTTGLSRIDYFLTDSIREPNEAERFFSEQPVFLPHGAACFQALKAPDVAPPPFVANGYVTLGSTHRPEKISAAALGLWAQILDRLPDARLLIFRDTLKNDSVRTLLAQRLQQAGADLARVDFGWDLPQAHHDVYARFDLLLDVFPWGSGTIAYDAMWMGVPIPTITGDRGSCRATASLLHHSGFPELVAESPDSYMALVQHLAEDRQQLISLRNKLRPAMQSTVCNAARFAHDVETCLKQFWQTYIESQQP
ncbi:MAG: tetratricopeptide repeat protein [Fuerstiella sp.]